MTMKRIGFLLALLLSSACAGNQTTLDHLRDDLAFFHHHLVGGDFVEAAAYVSPEAMDTYQEMHDPARNAPHLEDFTLLSLREDPDHKATAVIQADTRRHDSLTIRSVRYRELWLETPAGWRLLEMEVLGPRSQLPTGALPEDRTVTH